MNPAEDIELIGQLSEQKFGQLQQRIAVARAVAYPPRVLLMDEPLGALDLKLREVMQMELRRIQQELSITTVYVTHDQTEAMNMSDTIVVMNQGEIEQQGDAEDIYNAPRTSFVANFVGQVNTISGQITDVTDSHCSVRTEIGHFVCRKTNGVARDDEVLMAVRPELITISENQTADQDPDSNSASGQVTLKSFAGNLVNVTVAMADGSQIHVEDRPQLQQSNPGDQVTLTWSRKDAFLLTR